jgi:hypothetical protein
VPLQLVRQSVKSCCCSFTCCSRHGLPCLQAISQGQGCICLTQLSGTRLVMRNCVVRCMMHLYTAGGIPLVTSYNYPNATVICFLHAQHWACNSADAMIGAGQVLGIVQLDDVEAAAQPVAALAARAGGRDGGGTCSTTGTWSTCSTTGTWSTCSPATKHRPTIGQHQTQ